MRQGDSDILTKLEKIRLASSPAGSNTQIQFNDSSAFNGDSGLTFSKTHKVVTIAGITETASNPILLLSQTWNNSSVAFDLMKLNISTLGGSTYLTTASHFINCIKDTAPGNPSSVFNVNGVGEIQCAGAQFGSPNPSFGDVDIDYNQVGVALGSGSQFGWFSSADNSASVDTAIKRSGAAATVEIDTGTTGRWGTLKVGTYDASVSAVTRGLVVGHEPSSGTPTTGMGSGVLFNIKSSTTANQNAGSIYSAWTTATHASRTSKTVLQTVNNAGSLADALSIAGNGDASLPIVGSTYHIKSGSNAKTGTVTLSSGAATVSTTAYLTASSMVFFAMQTSSGTVGLHPYVDTGTNATSFHVTGAATDNSTYYWAIIEQD